MKTDLVDVYTAVDEDPRVKCVILTGETNKANAFCAGKSFAPLRSYNAHNVVQEPTCPKETSLASALRAEAATVKRTRKVLPQRTRSSLPI